MPSPPDPLVAIDEVERFGIGSAFLAPFVPRAITIAITTGGALGVMAFTWLRVGEDTASAPLVSEAFPGGASWPIRVSEAYADLVFAPGTYVVATRYNVDTKGNVTPGAGAIAGLSATRFDLRSDAVDAATKTALGWMGQRVVLPILSWGTDVKRWTAKLFAFYLLGNRGLGSSAEATGDARVIADGKDAEVWFRSVGRGEINPVGLVDSSAANTGGGLLAYPSSERSRRW